MATRRERLSLVQSSDGRWFDETTGAELDVADADLSTLIQRHYDASQQIAAWERRTAIFAAMIDAKRGDLDRGIDATGQVQFAAKDRDVPSQDVPKLVEAFRYGEWTEEELDQWYGAISGFRLPRPKKSDPPNFLRDLIEENTTHARSSAWIETSPVPRRIDS